MTKLIVTCRNIAKAPKNHYFWLASKLHKFQVGHFTFQKQPVWNELQDSQAKMNIFFVYRKSERNKIFLNNSIKVKTCVLDVQAPKKAFAKGE
jgi:hypothetical protein